MQGEIKTRKKVSVTKISWFKVCPIWWICDWREVASLAKVKTMGMKRPPQGPRWCARKAGVFKVTRKRSQWRRCVCVGGGDEMGRQKTQRSERWGRVWVSQVREKAAGRGRGEPGKPGEQSAPRRWRAEEGQEEERTSD